MPYRGRRPNRGFDIDGEGRYLSVPSASTPAASGRESMSRLDAVSSVFLDEDRSYPDG
jgi:hypothetical protein